MKSCRPERVSGGRGRMASAAGAPVRTAGKAARIREAPVRPRNAVSVRLAERVLAHRDPTTAPEPSAPAANPVRRPSGRRRLRLPRQPPRLVRHNRLPPSDRSLRRRPRHVRSVLPLRSAISLRPSVHGLKRRPDSLALPLPSR
jgi:hypothetical protein